MKVICSFCKTEYNLNKNVTGPVKCAVCGHTWLVRRQNQKSIWLMFIAALCALLAAVVFTVVVVVHYRAKQVANQPLTVETTDMHLTADDLGVPHFVVNGVVTNNSDDIYGVPNLVVLSYAKDGRVIARQKFLSPATLLDAGDSVSFSYTLAIPANGVEKITVELQK